MTTATIQPAHTNYADDPDYYRGRADAYDDSHTRSLDEMAALTSMAIDYATIPYALGYFDRVAEIRLERAAVTAAESEVAQTWMARKQGRERSTLHDTRRRPGRTQTA